MTLLTSQDIQGCIRLDHYTNITAGMSAGEIDKCELIAIETCRAKLRGRYDYEAMLTAKPALLIEWVCTIFLYQLYRRQNSRLIPEDVTINYDKCMEWLNDIRDGREHPVLPLITNEDGAPDTGTNDLRYGTKESPSSGDFYLS